MLMEQYLNELSGLQLKHERKLKARYVEFKKIRKTRVDPITTYYLVTVAWGLSTSFLSKFKSRMKVRQQSAVKNDDKHVDHFIDVTDEVEEGKTIIDNMNLATEQFTPSFLFTINQCRQQAIDDSSSITTAEYWQRHKAGREEFKQVDADTKQLWSLRSRQHLH